MIKDFGKTAEKLSGNPLGIIALFIVLLYGIAGLVLSTSANFLVTEERMPLIWFLVIFPFLVLLVFAWLVSHHHTKLYAPKDFVSDEAFLRALTPTEKRFKQQAEIEMFENENSFEAAPDITVTLPRNPRKYLGVMYDYGLAEDLAIKHLQASSGIEIIKDQELRRGDQRVQVDGLAVTENMLTAYEVQLIKGEHLNRNLRNRMADVAYKAMQLGAFGKNSRSKLVYVAVVDGLSDEIEEKLKSRFHEFSSASLVPIELTILDFGKLKKLYSNEDVA
ncbi:MULTISPECIES: hypothetical protein [Halomonadaceae]|uniref:hypothetical protein n=1 Tax=Halomonadaceae TaxID=28256 RepID=UPI0012F3389D|nr:MULTISPECIES: hypothetical protein [Halomonas]CAD5253298.1 conserved hypothetical protein [Halomonas sp. I3]CAD5255584.1 conserved hypothetical protein [Halomonas sp. 156]CAD5293485.1 conserved hypothetical protein [Halomonas sp. 113]CAD5294825.1 conserved hypothetical protein [Halomonas sp. 59]VXB78882.1 conserved hypothetical protein [Halomonas titanicae]